MYSIIVTTTCKKAATKMVELVNGIGYFSFKDAEDLKKSNSCISYKDTVMSHLSNLKMHHEVYGDGWPRISLNRR
jgi:hypothetical protein